MDRKPLATSAAALSLILMLAVPTVAAAKYIELSYRFSANTTDQRDGQQGMASISLSGRIRNGPDLQMQETGGETNGPNEYFEPWENEWTENETRFKSVGFVYRYEYSTYDYKQNISTWYGFQENFNGKMLVIWRSGATSAFTVNLNLYQFVKTQRLENQFSEYRFKMHDSVFQWDEINSDWILIYEYNSSSGEMGHGTVFTESTGVILTGAIKGGDGRYNGALMLSEQSGHSERHGVRYWDGFEEPYDESYDFRQFYGGGQFGPYIIQTSGGP